MANLILDTHAAIHELMDAGMPEGQAETVVRQHVRLIEHNLATKTDLKDIIHSITNLGKETITRFETTNNRIENLRKETIASIEATNTRIENLRKETIAEIKGVKAEIEILRQETIAEIKGVKAEIEILRQETIARTEATKVDLIKWIVAVNLGTASLIVALVVALVKLL